MHNDQPVWLAQGQQPMHVEHKHTDTNIGCSSLGIFRGQCITSADPVLGGAETNVGHKHFEVGKKRVSLIPSLIPSTGIGNSNK